MLVMTRSLVTLALSISLAFAAAPLSAQDATVRPRYAAGLAVGASQYDMSGVGTTAFARAFFDTTLKPWLIGQGAIGVFRPEEQFGGRNRYINPEAGLQAQGHVGAFRPFLGLGVGWMSGTGGRRTNVTVSGGGGTRFGLPGTPLDGIAELRVRGIGRQFGAATAEWTLGAAYRF